MEIIIKMNLQEKENEFGKILSEIAKNGIKEGNYNLYDSESKIVGKVEFKKVAKMKSKYPEKILFADFLKRNNLICSQIYIEKRKKGISCKAFSIKNAQGKLLPKKDQENLLKEMAKEFHDFKISSSVNFNGLFSISIKSKEA